MNSAHDELELIARAGAGRFAQTSLASGHVAVTRRVRRHRTARAAAGTVAGIGVIGGATWGGMSVFARGNALAPGVVTVPSTTISASAPPASPTAAPMPTFVMQAGEASEQRAEFLAGAYHVSVDDAKAALAAAVADQVPEATTAEGWPMPGTFDLAGAPTVRDIANLMVSARVQELTDLGVPRADWQTVLTEASLVEAETHVTSDMPKVARVLQNRLTKGMKLELDSTVRYVMDTTGAFNQEDQVVTDSPYNTYQYQGLPPGAIANPSDEAVRAVLNPAEGDWLFFVTVNLDTGEMAYATTFEDHQKNVQKLQTWIAAQPHS
jgi:UPF0755 protein